MSNEEFCKYAFIDNDDTIVDILVFDKNKNNTSIIETLCITKNYKQAIICDEYDYASVGSFWTGIKFIPIKDYPSWIWNDELNFWEPPISYPRDGKSYFWNESEIKWQEIE